MAYVSHAVKVATIVDGVTKPGKMQVNSVTEQQVENYRKMLLSMAEDARVACPAPRYPAESTSQQAMAHEGLIGVA